MSCLGKSLAGVGCAIVAFACALTIYCRKEGAEKEVDLDYFEDRKRRQAETMKWNWNQENVSLPLRIKGRAMCSDGMLKV